MQQFNDKSEQLCMNINQPLHLGNFGKYKVIAGLDTWQTMDL